jgi:outer membrane protein TolC
MSSSAKNDTVISDSSKSDSTKTDSSKTDSNRNLFRLSALEPAVFENVAAEEAAKNGPIEVTLSEAIMMALENNRELKVRRFTPRIRKTAEESAVSKFDINQSVNLSLGRSSRSATTAGGSGSASDSVSLDSSISRLYESGTRIEGSFSETFSSPDGAAADDWRTGLNLSLLSPLRRGKGQDVNLAAVRQARLDTRISIHELRGYTESIVSQTESAYWDCLLSKRQIKIYTESLSLAEQQLKETEEKIRVGQIANTELAAVQAELALRREGLINARSGYENAMLKLRKLLNPPVANPWTVELTLPEIPSRPETDAEDVESHVGTALQMRPEINQALLSIQKNDIELIVTRNGLLPKLDFFINLGRSGYADSFGDSFQDMDGDGYDVQTGLKWEMPRNNRAARATNLRATLNRELAAESLENLRQTIQVDVRSAWIETNRAKSQISATAATRRSQEEKYRAETEKYKVGLSTSYLVGQAQRDLLSSQIAEVQAMVNYYKSLVALYRADGSLLLRRGINAPGSEPVQQ